AKDQLDILIWDPSYADAALQIRPIAVVPAAAVHGIMESKASAPEPGDVANRLLDLQCVHAALCVEAGAPEPAGVPIIGVAVSEKGQLETFVAKGASLVVALFTEGKDGAYDRNIDAFDGLLKFVNDVMSS